jgi:sugar/nucleoside kinase (ribokinase family)
MIVAFGNPVYDFIQTPLSSTHERVLSGCSTNACLVLQRLGLSTQLVGRLGPDFYERFIQDTEQFGLNTFMELCGETGGFQLIYPTWSERTLDILGIAEPIHKIPKDLAQAQAIIIGPILQETSLTLIQQIAQQSSAPLILDPQGLLRRINSQGRIEHFLPDNFGHIAKLCHVIKANEQETQVLTGIDPRVDPSLAVKRLKTYGCPIAIVTIAEQGSIIYDGKHQYRIPAFESDVRDTTGAGDTYMAGFIYSYLQEPHNLARAGCYGSASSSMWIEDTGPGAHIDLNTIQARANQLIERVEVH